MYICIHIYMYASIYVYVCIEIYYKELAYMLIEAEKS